MILCLTRYFAAKRSHFSAKTVVLSSTFSLKSEVFQESKFNQNSTTIQPDYFLEKKKQTEITSYLSSKAPTYLSRFKELGRL